MNINTEHLKTRLERIDQRYNPEWDIIPNQPPVTWTDKELLDILNNVLQMIDVLQDRIVQLEKDLDKAGIPQATKQRSQERYNINAY